MTRPQPAPAPHPARWWRQLPDGRIQCHLCPRYCRLKEGQRAFCFVRSREADQMVLTTYGRSTGFCIDPIEKKPLNHFLPGTPVLSFGTAGCNLGCRFCQNWEISKSREVDSLASVASPEGIAGAAREHRCASVAYTYNDPVLWAEYAIDTAVACRRHGIQNVAVTAGFITRDARAEFFGAMDAANVDLKAFTDRFYHKICAGRLQPVLDTLVYLRHETDVWFEITNLVIPGENDAEAEIGQMTDWIVEHLGPDVPVHFTAFHPDFKMMDHPSTPPVTLTRCREIARANGIRYAYTGNVHDQAGDTTCCHHCGAELIRRDWYVLLDWRLAADGRCPQCGTACAGRFESEPGSWGNRRQPVRLADFDVAAGR